MSQANSLAPTDANELVRRMGAGDEEALIAFSRAYRRYSIAVALRLIRNAEDAEEIFHDALLKLYRASSKFDPAKGAVLPYFKTLLRHTALDRLKRKRLIVYVENPYELADRAALALEERSPADTAEAASRIERLRQAIAELSPALRGPLQALCETGESHGAIAEILQIPLGTAKASIRRGMQALRDALALECRECGRRSA